MDQKFSDAEIEEIFANSLVSQVPKMEMVHGSDIAKAHIAKLATQVSDWLWSRGIIPSPSSCKVSWVEPNYEVTLEFR